jgi:tetratricopeptide (TPR) repeat protein
MQLYKDAVKEFRKAKKIYNNMAAIEPDAYLPSLATVLEQEGKMFYEMKDFKNALDNFEQALVIREYQAANDPLSFSRFVTDIEGWIKEIKGVAK